MELNPILTDDEELEQTKNEDVVETNEGVNEETSGTPETSNAGVAQKKDEETKAEETKEAEPEQKPTKQPQSKEENSVFARQRREKEEAERLAKAKEEARIQAVIETLGGINPYTQERMVDAEDVNEYLLMKKIDAQGEDPLEKYPTALKNQKRELEKQEQVAKEEQAKAKKDIEDFMEKYPNVSLQDLEQDEAFNDYVDGKLGKKSLSDLYTSYLNFADSVAKKQQKEQKEKEIIQQAQKNTAVGSVTAPTPTDDDTYTFEELQKMTPSEMEKNWKKVQRSKQKLKIYY